MIKCLSPEDLDLIEQLKEAGVTYKECSEKFDVKYGDLMYARKKYREIGLRAFCPSLIKDKYEEVCKGRTLSECYKALVAAGIYSGSARKLSNWLNKYDISYLKLGTNKCDLTYRGVTGVTNIAKANGINPSTLFHRLERGMCVHDAVNLKKRKNHTYEYKGMIGAKRIADHFGVSRAALSVRLSKGQDVEFAVSQIIKSRKPCHDARRSH